MILYKAKIIKDGEVRKREAWAQNEQEAYQKLANYYYDSKVKDVEYIGRPLSKEKGGE